MKNRFMTLVACGALGLIAIFAAGCGGSTCKTDVCGPGFEFDSVVAVPDTGVTDSGRDVDIGGDQAVQPDGAELPGDIDEPADVAFVATDLAAVGHGISCGLCDNDAECAEGWKCVPVGAEKHCLRPCNDDGDCDNGFVCYASTATLHECLPLTFICPVCLYEPCADGMCCDFTTGACKACGQECDPCTYDYDCGSGLRCWSPNGGAGKCLPDCTRDTCLVNLGYVCTERGQGVSACVRDEGGCAECPSDKPYQLDGECVECRVDDHCLLGMACDSATHTCSGCRDGMKSCGDAGCVECCSDADCIDMGIRDKGCDILGTCDRELTCGDGCPGVFPVCALVGGVEQCVQCLSDMDCAASPDCGKCTSTYICMGTGGATCGTSTTCPATCADAGDCLPAWDNGVQQCFVGTGKAAGDGAGVCFDPLGTCNGISSCCGAGMKCVNVDFAGILGDGGIVIPSDRIVAPLPRDTTFCECETTTDCINGKECTPLTALCEYPDMAQEWLDLVCPGGAPMPSLPAKVCGTVEEIMFGRVAS